MNAHLLLLVLLTGLFAGVWNQDTRQNATAREIRLAQRPPVVQKSAIAVLTSHPKPVIAKETRSSRKLAVRSASRISQKSISTVQIR